MSRTQISEINAAVLDLLGLAGMGDRLSAVTVTLHRTTWPTARLEVILDQATGRTERQFVRLVPEGYEDPKKVDWLDKACTEAMERVSAWIDQATEQAKQATRGGLGMGISMADQIRDLVNPGEFFTTETAMRRLNLSFTATNESMLFSFLLQHGYVRHREATGKRRWGFIAPSVSAAEVPPKDHHAPHPEPNTPASQPRASLRPVSSPDIRWPKSPQQAEQPGQKSLPEFSRSSLPPDFGGASLLGQLKEVAALGKGIHP